MALTYFDSITLLSDSLLGDKYILHDFFRISIWICSLHLTYQFDKPISLFFPVLIHLNRYYSDRRSPMALDDILVALILNAVYYFSKFIPCLSHSDCLFHDC